MVTRKQFAGKLAALAVLPALSLGAFAAPSFAYVPSGDVTTVVVSNSNNAAVTNVVSSSASTGNNQANGGKGGSGGDSANVGTVGGNGGKADADADTGNGGDAEGYYGEIVIGGDSGSADALAAGGNGGSADAVSAGGAGGNGGDGGAIATGDASSLVAIQNEVNTNDTDVEVEDCGCDKYNEKFESAHNFSLEEDSFSLHKESDGNNYGHHRSSKGGDEELNLEKESTSVEENHWEKYSKTYVPVVTTLVVENDNNAEVANVVASDADTGYNVADGDKGGKGGASANLETLAGNGGKADADAESGNGGDAEGKGFFNRFHHNNHDVEPGDPFGGFSGDALSTALAGNGGDAASNSEGGAAGNGGAGGVIVTGYAESANAIITVANRNVTRIKR